MPKPAPLYTRLTKRSASVATYSSLWLAADHLLVVTSTGYTEEYRRLRLADIKGFFVTKSDWRLAWGIPWGIAVVFSAGGIANTLISGGTPLWSVLFFGLSLGVLAWNHLLGPGCSVFVVTGVQTVKLPSLYRRPKARKVLAKLEPLIAAAQADLAPSRSETAETAGAAPVNSTPPPT
jgi:hypothetical protein